MANARMTMQVRQCTALIGAALLVSSATASRAECEQHVERYYAEIRQAIANGLGEFKAAMGERRLEKDGARIGKLTLPAARRELPDAREELKSAQDAGGFGEEPASQYRLCMLETRISSTGAQSAPVPPEAQSPSQRTRVQQGGQPLSF
jgi:hypothetical protein